ncbi:MAG: glycosyltransferase family 4 protein [Moorellales bacterium]
MGEGGPSPAGRLGGILSDGKGTLSSGLGQGEGGVVKRVHIVTDVDLTERSAQPVHVLSLAKYLGRLGLEVHLIYPFWQREVPAIPPGVVGVPVRVPRKPFARARAFQVKLFTGLGRLPRPDVVYVRLSAGMVAPLIWSRIAGVPLFVEVNGIVDLEYLMAQNRVVDVRTWLKVRRMRMVQGLNLKRATGIVFVTDELKEYYTRRYQIPQERATVINNGVDLEIFQPMDKQQSRRRLGIHDGPPLLGLVGSLAPWQGIDDAIRAIKILRDRSVPCRLLIVGQGSEEARLQALARELGVADRVTFTGAVGLEVVPLYISACDICLTPKRNLVSGVSPLKLYEYMACAKPIVATDVPGLEVVANVGAGVSAKAGSPESLADTIEELIQRSHDWEPMGGRGRLYVETHASWQHVAERTVAFFKDRLGGTR